MVETTHLEMVENAPPDVRKKTTRRFYKSDPSFFFALFTVQKNPLFGAEKSPFYLLRKLDKSK